MLAPRHSLLVLAALCGCADNLTPTLEVDGGTAGFSCFPDLDGQLTRAELPVVLGAPVDYYVSPDGTPVDVAGTVDADGLRVWDYSAERPGDVRTPIAATRLAAQWYADRFPGGQFVLAAALGSGAATDGVYAIDDAALWFLGAASREESPASGTTLLVYDPPVALLRFPLEAGDRWTETAALEGATLDGLPYRGTDTYEIEVDGNGRLELPYIAFEQTYRVRTRVAVTPAIGGVTVTRRQVSFLFECFGEVARAVSRTDEPATDFTTAAELRRFAL